MTTLQITFNEDSNIGKTLLAMLEYNKEQLKITDPFEMTPRELEDKIATAHKQMERGEFTVINSSADLAAF